MEQYRDERLVVLMDGENTPLASGRLETAPDAPAIQVLVLDDKADEVAQHETIHIVSMTDDKVAVRCRFVRQRDDRVVLSRLSYLGQEFRKNLRVKVQFDSFVFPITGRWKGRREIRSIDLSCGGLAFYGESGLRDGERLEVVVPITIHPLVLRGEILRQRKEEDGRQFYVVRFLDMCNDEEFMVREAVFRVQLQDRSRAIVPGEEKAEVSR